MTALEDLHNEYLRIRPEYERLCAFVEKELKQKTREEGLVCTFDARAKDISSFLKKAVRKGYADPLQDVQDLAGVRASTAYHPVLSHLETIIRDLYEVVEFEDKGFGRPIDSLGYSGVHFIVRVPPERLAHHGAADLADHVCEIQLHTKAQSIWAEVSHRLLYKPPQNPPLPIARLIYRLSALMEIFDYEIELARRAVRKEPGYENAEMLDALESVFYRLVGRPYDSELSARILGVITPLLTDQERAGYAQHVRQFSEQHAEALHNIYKEYAATDRQPLIFQPETILIFDLIERDPFTLLEAWSQELPDELLRSLATIWGKPYPPED